MLLNELPDDCLLAIFMCIKELDFLCPLYRVCYRWSQIIAMRLRNERWLIRQFEEPIPKCVFVFTAKRLSLTHWAPLMPRLKIVDISYPLHAKLGTGNIIRLLEESDNLRGLIHAPTLYRVPITQHCRNLEMITTDTLEPYLFERGPHIRQLYVKEHTLNQVTYHAHRFPNLLRLHIENDIGPEDQSYTGPEIPSLEMFEFRSYSYAKFSAVTQFIGFQFIDKCPALKSAHVSMCTTRIHIDTSIIHQNLENLVVDFNYNSDLVKIKNTWRKIAGLLSKYPNLKNLALRFNADIKNKHLPVLLGMLPKLELLDVSGSPGITAASVEIVRDYCVRHRRRVAFYYIAYDYRLRINLDFPQWVAQFERVAERFDFMRNCFLKQFWHLPHLMDPMDDTP